MLKKLVIIQPPLKITAIKPSFRHGLPESRTQGGVCSLPSVASGSQQSLLR